MGKVYGTVKGEKSEDGTREWSGNAWVLIDQTKKTRPSTPVANTAKPPAAADLEDKPEDSPLVRASKKRRRAQVPGTVGNINPEAAADAIEKKK